MRTWLSLGVVTATAFSMACGGSGSSPTSPGTPGPTPVTGFPVTVVVYYDENANDNMDPGERIRVPDVDVVIGSRSAKSASNTGQALVTGVAEGDHEVTLRAETLPPYYRPVAGPVPVHVPLGQGSLVPVPLTLDIGGNQPNLYMAFGDSLTRGDGSATGGYPAVLQTLLGGHFGGAQVNNRGADATNSYEARERLQRNLRGSEPAYTLILYGTNDWHIQGCQDDPALCPTAENLRLVIQGVRAFDSLPIVGTLPPTNPATEPPQRNQWIRSINATIRAMAGEEGVVVADLEGAFAAQPNLPPLYSDGVHMNDGGYRVMAGAFFEAIAHGHVQPASTARRLFSRP